MSPAEEFERIYGRVIENIVTRRLAEMGIVTASPVVVKAINGTDITVHFVGDDETKTFVVQNVTGQTLTLNKKVTLVKFDANGTTATNSFIGFTK